MKRPTTQPHDVLLDKDGNVWYSDFGELFISKFDPKTLTLTEYPTKEFKPGAPVGNLSLEFDREGKLWFDTMHQGAIGSIDPKTGEIKYYPLPPEWNDNRVQLNFVGLRHDGQLQAQSQQEPLTPCQLGNAGGQSHPGLMPQEKAPVRGPYCQHR